MKDIVKQYKKLKYSTDGTKYVGIYAFFWRRDERSTVGEEVGLILFGDSVAN